MPARKSICIAWLLVALSLFFLSCKKNPDPKGAIPIIQKGLTKHNLADYAGAIKDFSEAIDSYPKAAAAYYYRGFSKHKLKDDVGAIEDYTQAIALAPNYAVAYLNRGLTRLAMGARRAGCNDVRKAGELGDDRAYEILKKFCR